MERKKYNGLDWIRAISCICILIWHVYANTLFGKNHEVADVAFNALDDIVYLFMAVSAFGICCGYYEKVMSGSINWSDFYKKRYLKILPFFSVLVLLDLASDFSINSLLEGTTELTLLFGLVPNELTVIGVGWFLGTVFLFYLIFPFFCVLIEKKSTAWVALGIGVAMNLIVKYYFMLHRKNFLRSLCFFLVGGLVFRYKEQIEKWKWFLILPVCIVFIVGYFVLGNHPVICCLITGALLSLGIVVKSSPAPIKFLSGISMEIYLAHMFIFRVVQKIGLTGMLDNEWLQYILNCILVIVGVCIFAFIMQKIIDRVIAGITKVNSSH